MILCLLTFTPAVLASEIPNYDVDSVTNTSDSLYTEQSFSEKLQTTTKQEGLNITPEKTTTYERKINIRPKKQMDTHKYWDHGGVKFGTGGAFKNGSSLNSW